MIADTFACISAITAALSALAAAFSAYNSWKSQKISDKMRLNSMDSEVRYKALEFIKLCPTAERILADKSGNISDDNLRSTNSFIIDEQQYCKEIRERKTIPNESQPIQENRIISESLLNLHKKIENLLKN